MKIDLQQHWGDRELYHVAELTSKIIDSMQTYGSVYLYTKESKNGENNGLYTLLDTLCDYWSWDKKLITISTTNPQARHAKYTVLFDHFNHAAAWFNSSDPVAPAWNKEKIYGMFIGRADAPRIRAIHNHKTFKYSDQGLTSFHSDLFNFMGLPDLVDYYMYSGQSYKDMISIKPYSDIDQVRQPPITPPQNSIGWAPVYEKIALEIVCETSTQPNVYETSEKLIRPMYHKRPFLLISSPWNLKYLREIGFKTFDGLIPEDYDQLQGIQRVDRVFQILDNLITSGNIHNIINQSQDILEHNQTTVIKMCQLHSAKMATRNNF